MGGDRDVKKRTGGTGDIRVYRVIKGDVGANSVQGNMGLRVQRTW